MAEGDWPWDLNPCMAAMPGWDHVAWAEKNHVTSISFSKIQYPRLDRGGRKDCVFVGILKDFGISLKTLSHYS